MSVETPDWVRDAVFYQIFPDRFASSARVVKPGPLEPWDAPPTRHGFKGGDLLGIVERLHYREDLGVNALYLNPVLTSASNHRYHTDDYEHVDPMLGGDAALRELLDACHARGMRVILDGVFNHSGRGWFPFHHVVENGADSPYRSWFYLDAARMAAGRPLNAYPDAAEEDEMRRVAGAEGLHGGVASERFFGYRGWWDLPALPKIRVEEAMARAYLLDIAEKWVRFGADGWRLDVPEEIEIGFWQEFRKRVKATNPDAYLVGEIWRVRPGWVMGDTFDGLMNYPLAEALISFTAGSHLDWSVVNAQDQYRDTIRPLDGHGFLAELTHLMRVYDPAVTDVQLDLLGSHDTARFVTVCGGDAAAYRLATVAQMTLPGAPCIYYGDEIGMTGGNDPDCRGAFPRDPATWDAARRAFVKGAVAFRGEHAALRRGEFRALSATGSAAAYLRSDAEATFIVALNAGEAAEALTFDTVDLPEMGGRTAELVRWDGWPDGDEGHVTADDGRLAVTVPARGACLVRLTGSGS